MSDQGEEGQVPPPPELEGGGELPPRPTVRESFRRGLFVRLPTEGETIEGLSGPKQGAPEQPAEEGNYPDQARVEQYPEQVADPYPGWRQAADGSWEAVSPEASSYSQASEPAAPEAYPEIDQSANLAPAAGREPLIHEESGAEAASWTFTPEQEVAETAVEVVVPVTPQLPEIVSGLIPEVAPEVAIEAPAPEIPQMPQPPEVVPEGAAEVAPAPEMAPETVLIPEAEAPVAEVTAPVAEVAPEAAPSAEATPAAEPAPEAVSAAEDPVAAAGLYIPGDVELLEGDMPLYGENDKVPPRFAGGGLGEPIFVEFGDLARMLVGLRQMLPKGTRLTYNYDHERAWVRTSADIDLPSFAERVEALAAEGKEASA